MRPFRIAIDLRMVGRQPHGIARYALGLWKALPERSDLQYLALVRPEGRPQVALCRPTDVIRTTRSRYLAPAEQVELPIVLKRAGADLLHATSFSVPAGWRGPLVLSLHDLTHLSHPELHGPGRRTYYRLVVGPAARRAQRVLTVSEFSRREIEARLQVPLRRVTVAPNAIDLHPLDRPPARADPPLLLALGNGKPHKNLVLLAQALPRLNQPARLWLVGSGLSALRSPKVTVQGPVDDAALARLYAQATLFLCPSKAEGFGLPPLEAARCGSPVLVAAGSALSEIWQGTAPLLPPDDPEAWARAIDRLLANAAERAALARACEALAARYADWQPLAIAAERAYREALVGRRPRR